MKGLRHLVTAGLLAGGLAAGYQGIRGLESKANKAKSELYETTPNLAIVEELNEKKDAIGQRLNKLTPVQLAILARGGTNEITTYFDKEIQEYTRLYSEIGKLESGTNMANARTQLVDIRNNYTSKKGPYLGLGALLLLLGVTRGAKVLGDYLGRKAFSDNNQSTQLTEEQREILRVGLRGNLEKKRLSVQQ